MALSLRRGRVTAVVERLPELVRCEVDGTPCIAYPRLTGGVEEGDEVIVNVQARELGLGSGGFDVLYVNLTRGLDLRAEPDAHVMKLPYTPLQHAVPHAEESNELDELLDGMPVVCCSLHSQLAPACAGIGAGARVAYAQLPGGALPVSLSDAVRELKGSRPAPRGNRRRRVPGRRRPLRVDGIGPRVGEGLRVRRRRLLPSGPASSARDRGSATAGSRRPRRRTPRRRSAGGRLSRRGCRTRTSANATAACRTTRKPCSRCVLAR